MIASPGTPDPADVPDPGTGRRLAVDVGSVRVGVALSDPAPLLATPLVTLARDVGGGWDLEALVALIAEHEVVEIVVGLPKTLAGNEGVAAQEARRYAAALAGRVPEVPLRLQDERMTTVAAARILADRGVRGSKQRSVIDQAAAVEILQAYLERRAAALRRAAETEGPGS